MIGARACVYTALLNDYERLNEQEDADHSTLDHICFTDNPSLESETWSVRHVEPLLPGDPVRSQRFLKICAHSVLPEYDVSLYIDNAVSLRVPGQNLISSLLGDGDDLALFAHSFRETVQEEFDEVGRLGLDSNAVCREQAAHYRAVDAESLGLTPLWTGLMLRRHLAPQVVEAMELWFRHVLRYSHRDQLSVWFALRARGLTPLVHTGDVHETRFHRWPVLEARDRSRSGTSAARALEARLGDSEMRLERAERDLRAIRETRSWRWTAPLRLMSRILVRVKARGRRLATLRTAPECEVSDAPPAAPSQHWEDQ
jgi:hypothetical protein